MRVSQGRAFAMLPKYEWVFTSTHLTSYATSGTTRTSFVPVGEEGEIGYFRHACMSEVARDHTRYVLIHSCQRSGTTAATF